jgi:hypothetical protein
MPSHPLFCLISVPEPAAQEVAASGAPVFGNVP